MENLTAKASTVIEAPAGQVWRALVTPETIKRYMFGATVVADWKVGGSIVWRGEVKGKPYEDKGEIVRFEPEHQLRYTHWSPLSGTPDTPENRHMVTVDLAGEDGRTRVSLSQDGNHSEEERAHSEANWNKMLGDLKRIVEST